MTAQAGGGSPDRVGGGVSRPVARGQKFMCCVRNPRNINVFVRVPGWEESGSRPGGSVTGVTGKLFMCQMFMCLYPAPIYTPARNYYIHRNFVFGMNFPKNCISVTRKHVNIIFREWISRNYISRIRLWFRELHGILVWELFSWKISFNDFSYMK